MFNVAILLCTFNGEKYLPDQLKSLSLQRKVCLTVFVIDDSSSDKTLELLKNSNLNIKIVATQGNRDPVKNFMKLIKLTPDEFDYYCFCDQDDYWLKNKLIFSIHKLNLNNAYLCGSRTLYTDQHLKITGSSLKFKKKSSLKNAIVQSIAGGNTMVWTKKFHQLLNLHPTYNPASHDWYLYQFCCYFGFKFIFIQRPTILYRQHQNNAVGSNAGFFRTLKRIVMGLKGQYKIWHEMNKNHFNQFEKYDHPTNSQLIVNRFYKLRTMKNLASLLSLYELGVYRQTLQGQIMLYIATLIKKI